MTKSTLRTQMRATLASLKPAERNIWSMASCRTLAALPEYVTARSILFYLALPDEVQADPLIERAWQEGRRVTVPRVDWEQGNIRPVELRSWSDGLTIGRHGVRQPPAGPEFPPEELDLVVVPGLAFDPQGRRLGRGAGYYDRFLVRPRMRAVRCGLALPVQLVDVVPTDSWDQPLDLVVAAERVFRRAR